MRYIRKIQDLHIEDQFGHAFYVEINFKFYIKSQINKI